MTERTPQALEGRIENLTERLLGAFEELDFLHSLTEILSNPAGVEDLDAYLLAETIATFSASGGFVVRTAEDGFAVSARSGVPDEVADYLNHVLVGELVRDGELSFLVDDLHRALSRRGGAGRRSGKAPEGIPRGFLAVALAAHDEVRGVICLVKNDPGDTFSSGDLKLLSTLGTQAGFFLKNADLMRGFKTRANRLGRRLERLESDTRNLPDISRLRGRSPAMRHLARQVEGAAATEATVLMLGESGSGKSMVARILHRMSPRRSGPFVEINCGAVPAALIESELFGHARGAFTGAERDRPGLFEEAEGGAILLDEVADLPLEAQVKLLTVLEQRRVRRVGENRDRGVNARVIAATNQDLEALVRRGEFRQDLFYRLNVITLAVPPLRERREEILPLARQFLEELSRETHRRVRAFSREAEDALLAYGWPGNVRELRNVVERSLLLVGDRETVEAGEVPLQGKGSPSRAAPVWEGQPLGEAMRLYERSILEAALEQSGGVVSRAAKALGISRTNLHNKLHKHGLTRHSTWDDSSH